MRLKALKHSATYDGGRVVLGIGIGMLLKAIRRRENKKINKMKLFFHYFSN